MACLPLPILIPFPADTETWNMPINSIMHAAPQVF
jgi:hypothetical protein